MQSPSIWFPEQALVVGVLGVGDDGDVVPEEEPTYEVVIVVDGTDTETGIEVDSVVVELVVKDNDCEGELNEQVPSRFM